LDAALSSDPHVNSSNMTVKWDLNGDGIVDTASYRNQGVNQIVARLMDERHHASKSIPIGIRVVR
jgi:hypothetical protein